MEISDLSILMLRPDWLRGGSRDPSANQHQALTPWPSDGMRWPVSNIASVHLVMGCPKSRAGVKIVKEKNP